MTGVHTDAPPDDDEDGTTPHRSRTAIYVTAPLLVVLVFFVWVLASSEPATDRLVSSPLVGRPAPPLGGETLAGGRYDMGDDDGRFVLVNFFATWCTPCVREHPELVEFQRRHERAGDATVVSVLYSDQVSDARAFFEREGGDWPVVIDPTGRSALDFGVAKVPESYLVASDGRVVAKIAGGVTSEGLDRILEDLRGTA